jgi:hypothetical protein
MRLEAWLYPRQERQQGCIEAAGGWRHRSRRAAADGSASR